MDKQEASPKSKVAGYEPEQLLKAPLSPPDPVVTTEERTFLRKKVQPPERFGFILGVVGIGFILLDLWALLFLPAFSFASWLILALVGILLFSGGLIAKLIR